MQRCRIVSFRSWSCQVTPSIRRRQLIWKTSSFVKSVAKSVQHSEAYNRMVKTTVLDDSLDIVLAYGNYGVAMSFCLYYVANGCANYTNILHTHATM